MLAQRDVAAALSDTMELPAANPRLRFVRDSSSTLAPSELAARLRRRSDIARETRAAAAGTQMEPTDPRWVLAVRTQMQLQGTMLTPQRRRQVLRTARLLGVRAFDANLIIAIVQDRTRRGEPLAAAAPTIAMVNAVQPHRDHRRAIARWLNVLLAAVIVTVLLLWWVMS